MKLRNKISVNNKKKNQCQFVLTFHTCGSGHEIGIISPKNIMKL
jgi:hypothetical protein